MATCEKMIYIEMGISQQRRKAGKWQKDTKDKEATQI